jgi:hypothetical protein
MCVLVFLPDFLFINFFIFYFLFLFRFFFPLLLLPIYRRKGNLLSTNGTDRSFRVVVVVVILVTFQVVFSQIRLHGCFFFKLPCPPSSLYYTITTSFSFAFSVCFYFGFFFSFYIEKGKEWEKTQQQQQQLPATLFSFFLFCSKFNSCCCFSFFSFVFTITDIYFRPKSGCRILILERHERKTRYGLWAPTGESGVEKKTGRKWYRNIINPKKK